MAQAVANWWGGLSDMHKGLSVIASTAVGTAAVVLALIQWVGIPATVKANTEGIQANTQAVKELAEGLEDLKAGQDLQTCILLARENGSNALECTR